MACTPDLSLNSFVLINTATSILRSTFRPSLTIHIQTDNLIRPSWKATETKIFDPDVLVLVNTVTHTAHTVLIPLFNYCGFVLRVHSTSLIQSMFHVFTHDISGRWQTGQFRTKVQQKHSNTKHKKIEFQHFYIHFIPELLYARPMVSFLPSAPLSFSSQGHI